MIEAREIAKDIDVSRLPHSLTELIEVIGLVPALRLVERCGGRRLYVPKKLDPGHSLISVLGQEAAGRLCQYFHTCTLEVPKHDAWLRAVRDREIRLRHALGVSSQTLAEDYWLSLRHVRRITMEH